MPGAAAATRLGPRPRRDRDAAPTAEARSCSFTAAAPRSTPRWPGAASRPCASTAMRVTDAATLEVTEAVLCGTVNKRIVRDGALARHSGGRDQRPRRQHCWSRSARRAERRRPRLRRHRSYRPIYASFGRFSPPAFCRSSLRSPWPPTDRMPTTSTPTLRPQRSPRRWVREAFLAITNVPRVLRTARRSNLRASNASRPKKRCALPLATRVARA